MPLDLDNEEHKIIIGQRLKDLMDLNNTAPEFIAPQIETHNRYKKIKIGIAVDTLYVALRGGGISLKTLRGVANFFDIPLEIFLVDPTTRNSQTVIAITLHDHSKKKLTRTLRLLADWFGGNILTSDDTWLDGDFIFAFINIDKGGLIFNATANAFALHVKSILPDCTIQKINEIISEINVKVEIQQATLFGEVKWISYIGKLYGGSLSMNDVSKIGMRSLDFPSEESANSFILGLKQLDVQFTYEMTQYNKCHINPIPEIDISKEIYTVASALIQFLPDDVRQEIFNKEKLFNETLLRFKIAVFEKRLDVSENDRYKNYALKLTQSSDVLKAVLNKRVLVGQLKVYYDELLELITGDNERNYIKVRLWEEYLKNLALECMQPDDMEGFASDEKYKIM